jgi:dCMP deaminase
VLGKSLTSEFPHLDRDIRALDPDFVVSFTSSFVSDVKILEKENMFELDQFDEVVLSEDDIGRGLFDKYLKDKKITWDTVFLRWNKMNAITNNPVNPDRKISEEELDKEMIKVAEKEAERSSDWWRHVGAVLVKEGKIILSGHNKHAVTENTAYIEGEPRSNFDAGPAIADLHIFQHGEASIISEAAKQGIKTEGTYLYITTFPCPTCAMLVAKAGIKKVYYKEGYSLLDAERILKQVNVELVQVLEK